MKLKDNKNIFCSVYAGYSSVMMALKIKEWYPDHNIIYAMANTSKERAESLEFMNKCDEYFGLNMYWIEADFNMKRGDGVDFKIVKYSELKRNGEIFETGIKKLGIASKINAWCNRDMKIVPLKKFADSIFGLDNYSIAVGIRADEMDRVKESYFTNNTFYPLLDNGISTKDRNKFWSDKPIQINLPAYKGNCELCFKKSNRKLMTIIKEEPQIINWWQEMTKKYSQIPIEDKPAYNSYAENGGMNFFRNNISIEELVEMASKPFRMMNDEYIYENDLFDQEEGCGSGCVIF
jgi:3'-phosphoadenosine 5'-phosphosulfate sulfotransferase (PAPS reductase)/FAD synthetase